MQKSFALLALSLVLFACSPINSEEITPPAEPVELAVETENALAPAEVFGVSIDNLTDGATVAEAPILIAGKVSSSAISVSVNDYELSKYEPGSGEWSYFASPDFQNLSVGENTFEVIATGPDGESASVSLKLNYEPAE